MAVSSASSDEDVMATINITPFTDVLLVLLIIFIILASVQKEPRLPLAHNKQIVENSEIVVTIDDKSQINIGTHTLHSMVGVPEAFAALADQTNHQFDSVIIKADPKADYGTVLQVMDAAKKVGLTNFGLANKTQGSKS